jgi:polysaccharide biosynthesis transport protein
VTLSQSLVESSVESSVESIVSPMRESQQFEEFDPQKYWLVLKRRWPIALATLAGCLGLAVAGAYWQKPTYEAQGRLLVQSNRTNSLTGVGDKIGSLESLKREGNPMDTQAVVIQSLPLVQQVIDKLKLQDKKGGPLHPTDLKLKVEPIAGTDVLKVSYDDKDPEQAAAVVNQLMRAYIDNNIDNNRTEVVAASGFLEEQLPRAKAELDRTSEALRQFRSDNGIVELDKESIATVDMLKGLAEQNNQARTLLADLAAQQTALSNQAGIPLNEAVNAASLSQSAGVQAALTDRQRIESQLAIERTRYRDDHPNVAVLIRQVKALDQILGDRIVAASGTDTGSNIQMSTLQQGLVANYIQMEAQRQGLINKIGVLENLQANFKQRADDIPSLSKGQDDLNQRRALAKKSYETLRAKLEDARIAESQTVGNARIIQPALAPVMAANKNRNVLLLGGTGLGLMLGIAAAFWADLADRSLKSVKEAQTLYRYTLLGVVPRFRLAEGQDVFPGISPRVVVANAPRSIVHEAYRMLQANLKFTSFDRKVKTIVITSAVPGEGKSEVAANLAATLAQSGKKVLLIDADMRSPSQHHLWGMVNSVGLSNVIVEPEHLDNALQSVIQNLTVLTAGVMPPDPITLLESESMHQLLQKLSQSYEYILFDSPPLAGMADAAVLGKIANGVLMVARPGTVTYTSAAAAKDLLQRSGAHVLGLIANGVNLKQEPDNFFYYTGSKVEPSRVLV